MSNDSGTKWFAPYLFPADLPQAADRFSLAPTLCAAGGIAFPLPPTLCAAGGIALPVAPKAFAPVEGTRLCGTAAQTAGVGKAD